MEPSITDWISAISSAAGALVAILTGWFAYKQYLQPPVQENEPTEASTTDDVAPLQDMPVFETSNQTTTLRIHENTLQCHLEDARPDKGGHQWTLNASEIDKILREDDIHINSGYKVRTGTFSIGRRRNWLYSKALFPEPEYLKSQLRDLLKRTQNGT